MYGATGVEWGERVRSGRGAGVERARRPLGTAARAVAQPSESEAFVDVGAGRPQEPRGLVSRPSKNRTSSLLDR